jgi:hypothetical protein
VNEPSVWTQWIGLIGVVVGAILTGTIQIVLAAMNSKHEQRTLQRKERKSVYAEALWEVRELPAQLRRSLLAEKEATEQGAKFEAPDFESLHAGLDPAVFQLRLLGREDIAKKVAEYRDTFVAWVFSQEPEQPLAGFDALLRTLDTTEAEIVQLMRRDLGY